MHLTSAITLAIMATSALAAPKPTCTNGYMSEGGGDGFLCYKVSCNKIVKGAGYKTVAGKNIKDCLDKCYLEADGCMDTSFEHATKKCTFYHGGDHKPLRTQANNAYDAAVFIYDNSPCLD